MRVIAVIIAAVHSRYRQYNSIRTPATTISISQPLGTRDFEPFVLNRYIESLK